MSLKLEITDSPACLGHSFIVGLSGPELSDPDRVLLETLRPLGVLLRAPNFRDGVEYSLWLLSLKDMLREAQQIIGRDKLLVTIDHEGGRVHRAPAPLTHFPYAMQYAARAAEVAQAMAVELASIGINLSLAPVADIHSNPQNPVIGKRSFGTTPEAVIATAVPFMETLQRYGVLACAKHFPGHGDTSQDSHLELPRLRLQLEQLRERELLPFRALIAAGVPMILTAHVKFLDIDKRNPATLSKKVLQGILRDELSFTGVILSDDLDMQAIADNYSEADIAVRGVTAGLDMFLFNHEPRRGIELAKAILQALRQKKVREHLIEETFERVQRLYEALAMHTPKLLDTKVFAAHAALRAALETEGNEP